MRCAAETIPCPAPVLGELVSPIVAAVLDLLDELEPDSELEALDRGEDVPGLFTRKPSGQKLDYASQAGFAEQALREVVQATGPLCRAHGGRR